MASSDDFREQLKAGNITEALALALSKAVELKITTWVTSAADDSEAAEVKPGHRLRTCINMIDGNIKNEIGDQFIGNGPYKELRQFHLDQVAEGNQIIQKNLKSLQKLFEVLVAMQHQAATTAVIEPDALSLESQFLPSTEEVTDTGLANDAISSSVEVTPLTQQHFTIAAIESAIEESALHPNTVSQEDVAQEPPALSEEPVSFLTTPPDSIQELDSETDEDDWDDSILDLLESLPVPSPSTPEGLDPELDEDRRNLIAETPESDPSASDLQANQDWGILRREDFESVSTSPEEPHIETLSSEVQEDWGWGDLVAEEPASHPTALDSPLTEQEGTLNREDFPSLSTSSEPHLETSYSQIDEDWGDMLEEESEPNSDQHFPSMDSLDLEEDEEWDEWVVEEPEPLRDEPVAELDSYALGEDEDWGDLEDDSDVLAASPNRQESVPDLEIDDDWDALAAEIDVDTNAGFDLSASVEDTNAVESPHHPIENLDLSETLQEDSSTEEGLPEQLDDVSPFPVTTNHPQDAAHNQKDFLFRETQPDSVIPDDNDVDITEEAVLTKIAAEDFSSEAPDDGFAEHRSFIEDSLAENAALTSQEFDRQVLSTDSDPQAVSENDLDAEQKPVEKRVPPPPPPRRGFPNQHK